MCSSLALEGFATPESPRCQSLLCWSHGQATFLAAH